MKKPLKLIFNFYMLLAYFIVQMYSSSAFAELILKNPTSSNPEFIAYVKSQPHLTHYVDHHQNSNPTTQQVEVLNGEFKKAQDFYFQGLLIEAGVQFEKVIAHRHLADWKFDQRITLMTAIWRRSQLSKDPVEQRNWLTLALQYDSDLPMDTELFPPPMINSYKSIRENLRYLSWDVRKWSEYFNQILVNGTAYDLSQTQKIPLREGKSRVTFLSFAHNSVTKVATADEIINFVPQIKPLVSGSCDHPQNLSQHQDVSLFYNFDCVIPNPSSRSVANIAKKNLNNLVPINNSLLTHQDRSTLPKDDSPVSPAIGFIKKNWWWVAIGAGAIILYNQSQKHDSNNERSSERTTREGFGR